MTSTDDSPTLADARARALASRSLTSMLSIFCALMGAFATAGCSEYLASLPESGCTARGGRLAERLDDLDVIELRPAGAALREQSSGCSDSSNDVYAERVYGPARTIGEVVGFYRRTVPAAGWKAEFVRNLSARPDNPPLQGARMCFSKTIEGTRTLLSVNFQSDFEKSAADALGRDLRDFVLIVRAIPSDETSATAAWLCG